MLKKLIMIGSTAAMGAFAQSSSSSKGPGPGDWEIGVIGGYSYSPYLTITGVNGSADGGFRSAPVIGVFGGNDTYRYWSGEMRYTYRYGGARLSSGSITTPTFGAHTHIINADFLGHFRPRESRVRPFVA